MKTFIIKKPYIIENDKCARLEAVIKCEEFEKIHFFEVQKEYSQYLCFERSDAFVVSLLYFAMVNGYNIECEVPMSEKLYYQLTRILIPSMVKYHPDFFHMVSIKTKLDSVPIKNEKGVGAAVSGGVDSFYTIISNLQQETTNYNITHLLVANSYNIFRGDEDTRKRFAETVNNSKLIADELGLPLITMYTNHSEFWFKRYQNIFCLKYASYPYALQKLFSVYYFSSGYGYDEFTVFPEDWDSAHYDALSAPQLSNENFTFLLSGAEVNRAEKVVKIAKNKVVQNRLQVCNIQQENCSVCYKCMRTEFGLYACGELDKYNNVFDLEKFYEKKDKALIGLLSVQSDFDRENIELMKKNNIVFSKKILVLGKIGRIYYLFRQQLKKIPIISKVYYGKIKKRDEFTMIDKYNMDKEFAKQCDSGIV